MIDHEFEMERKLDDIRDEMELLRGELARLRDLVMRLFSSHDQSREYKAVAKDMWG